MSLLELVTKNRSRRRFYQDHAIERETLVELVNLARLSPSGMNRQPLKFFLSNTPEMNARIFPHLGWAGYLEGWGGPAEGERPSAYIIILGDKRISESFGIDPGIAAQSIMLGATEMGLGGCIIGSAKQEQVSQALALPDHFAILLVLALGKPKELAQIEPLGADGDIRYWRDAEGGHHVPKRSLEEIIIN
ncbi:MAG: nitroreductase family protein [Anaerolineales bacterium]|nr:nitroreductase family protein [Anaerolineales bacterium]